MLKLSQSQNSWQFFPLYIYDVASIVFLSKMTHFNIKGDNTTMFHSYRTYTYQKRTRKSLSLRALLSNVNETYTKK